jgi:hypothetical protein
MHQCFFYAGDHEHRTVVTQYIHEGLRRGEKVLVFQDTSMLRDILHDLQQQGVLINTFLQREQLVMISSDPATVDNALFDPEEAVRRLHQEVTHALRDGYPSLRVTGDMSWALALSPATLLTYEATVNQTFPPRCWGLCQYDQRVFPSTLLIDVAALHPAIIRGSQLIQNATSALMTDLTLSLT